MHHIPCLSLHFVNMVRTCIWEIFSSVVGMQVPQVVVDSDGSIDLGTNLGLFQLYQEGGGTNVEDSDGSIDSGATCNRCGVDYATANWNGCACRTWSF